MAEIFLAELHADAGFARTLVVKRILPHLSTDPDFIKMFIDEAVIAARLVHPNLVAVHDFGSLDGAYYMAMEHVDGVDVHRLLQRAKVLERPLTAAEVATLGAEAARGLAYAHALRREDGQPLCLVHRDISPHNLMVSVGGDVKVMDFGIAKAAAGSPRTAVGVLKGKLAYMAPEQAAGGAAEQRSDQFSLGVVLWEALTGRRLFMTEPQAHEVQLLSMVQACQVPSIRSLRPEVSATLERIIMRTLAREPAARYPDMTALEHDLTNFRFALGEAGIVHLGDLMRELAPYQGAEAGTWSWQSEDAQDKSAGITRKLPLARASGVPAATAGYISRTPLWARSLANLTMLLILLGGLAYPLFWPGPAGGAGATAPPPPPLARLLLWHRPNALQAATPLPVLPPPPSDRGRLSLRTQGPELEVYLGDRRLGTTPLADEDVPAGRLELRLVNERADISRQLTIEVPAGGSILDILP